MIRLKFYSLSGNTEQEIEPTRFPDGTSQVWKLDLEAFNQELLAYEIIWKFEEESELFHVAQLKTLLDGISKNSRITTLKLLNIPFLPYGRQDHLVSNSSTFAQYTFSDIINNMEFDRVMTFDPHGQTRIKNLFASNADKVIDSVFKAGAYDLMFYPDAGAFRRYGKNNKPYICGEKIREESTGKILKYNLFNPDKIELAGKTILIVDDICDYGRTFIEAAELLNKENVGEIGLYVSHGLFSGGFDSMRHAGILHFYTTNSLTRNKDGIPV